MPNKKQFLSHLGIIALLAVLAMSSSYYNGLTGGNDLPQHYQFAQTIYDSLAGGEIYPSYNAASNYGYGDVGLRFYPPLAYYALAVFCFIAGNWYAASFIVFTLIFFIGGLGVYFWAREEFPASQSLLAAAIYIFVPYHLNQIYNAFMYAEFAAGAIIPFVFLFITRVCRDGKPRDVIGLSIAYALLILTHLPLTIIGSIAFGIYALVLLERKSALKTLLRLQIAVAAALAADSFYWLRMATEIPFVRHSSEDYFSNRYSYHENFLFAPQNILNFSSDTSTIWLADLMLLAVLLVSIPTVIYLFRERKNLSRFIAATAAVFAFAVFFATPLSQFVWDNFPLLQKVQFPWRWLGIVSAVAAIFASIGIIKAAETMKQSKNILLPVGLGFVLLVFVTLAAFIVKGAVFYSPEEFNAVIADPVNSPSFDCWWSSQAKQDAFRIAEKIAANGRNYEIKSWQPLERKIKIAAGEPTEVRVATFYYPRWQATVNGEQAIVKADENGAILISVAEQRESEINLVFREPYFVRIANYVSIFVWLILGIGTIVLLFGKPSEIEAEIG